MLWVDMILSAMRHSFIRSVTLTKSVISAFFDNEKECF